MQEKIYSKNSSSICVAFLNNKGRKHAATMQFNGNSYNIPTWSVSVLPDCKNVVYNTAQASDILLIIIRVAEAMMEVVGLYRAHNQGCAYNISV